MTRPRKSPRIAGAAAPEIPGRNIGPGPWQTDNTPAKPAKRAATPKRAVPAKRAASPKPEGSPKKATPPVPTQAAMLAQWEPLLRRQGAVYRKTATVHARVAERAGTLTTVIGGKGETMKKYAKGAVICHGAAGERYSHSAAAFAERYVTAEPLDADTPALEKEGFARYAPTGRVWALRVADGGGAPAAQRFVAPWGSEMEVGGEDYLCMPFPAAGEVYRIEGGVFRKTYAREGGGGGGGSPLNALRLAVQGGGLGVTISLVLAALAGIAVVLGSRTASPLTAALHSLMGADEM